MGATTVRLDDDDEAILDLLAPEYGGRSSVIRHALRTLAAERGRLDDLQSLLAEWDADAAPVSDEDVAAMADRYGL
jgi:Arc/MetJ-type ribon-helix-helix transcriptional regulator